MIDERAIEVGQLSQPAQTNLQPGATVGYFEPNQLAELSQNGRLYLVADGLGGAASGQIAGQYTIQKILHGFYTTHTPDPEARLLGLIRQANADIFERNNQYPQRRRMATTLAAALIRHNKLFVANVGDNQIYVVWDQDIELLKPEAGPAPDPDQAEASDAKAGQIAAPAEPPAKPPDQPAISTPPGPPQALGLTPEIKIGTVSRRLFAGDIVVLCSGGLAGYVTELEIAKAVTRHSPEQAIARLLALAAQRGNRDHIAMSAARILSSPATAPSAAAVSLPAAPKWSNWDTLPKPVETSPPKSSSVTKSAPSPSPQPASQRKRWLAYGLGIAALVILLCGVAWLAWRYFIPPDLATAVPILGNMVATGADDETEAPDAGSTEAGSVGPEATGQVEVEATQASPPAAASLTPNPQRTLVAESNSPLATPESAFVSPVSSPASESQQDSLQAEATAGVRLVPATPSPTPAPTIELPPNCENKARFVRDVTIPDGTRLAPAEKFEKVWLLQNAGDCPWGPGYTARFISGDYTGIETEAPILKVTPPEAEGEISVSMIAPATAGRYRGDWQMFDLSGTPFGPKMFLEIEVTPPDPEKLDTANLTTLYDFIEKAPEASWSAGETAYTLQETEISETLKLPAPQGLVARGAARLRGNVESAGQVLLTYPDQEQGFIEGKYAVDTPLQPADALAVTMGFIKLSILSDDGVTFEVLFTPNDGSEQTILSRTVQYKDSPVTQIQPLAGIEPGQTGTFTLRVVGRDSLSQDWAVWIDLRLIRP